MNHASVAADAVGAAGFGARGLARPAGKNDLSVFLADHGEAMGLVIEYDTALFDGWRIAAFAPMLRTLLAALIADPDHPVGHLPLLEDAARAIITGYETRHGLAVLDPAGAPAPVGVWGPCTRSVPMAACQPACGHAGAPMARSKPAARWTA
ncbi:condensation domain-containing protein [Tistrella bauzanensis]